MVNCALCGRDVDDVQYVTPDLITAELVDSVDDGEEDFAGDDDVKVCSECMGGLKGE